MKPSLGAKIITIIIKSRLRRAALRDKAGKTLSDQKAVHDKAGHNSNDEPEAKR